MAIKFDKKVECNDEFVALRMINNGQNMKIGGIYVPDTTAQNNRLGHYVIESIGKTAKEEFGLNVGDYVMADKLSSYGHTEPIALMDYKNIICKTNSDKSNYYPLKNMVFVQPDKHDVEKVDGIYLAGNSARLNVGTVVDISYEEGKEPLFKIGDKVMLAKKGDIVDFGNNEIHIYKIDQIICKILED